MSHTRYPRIFFEKLQGSYRANDTNSFNWYAQIGSIFDQCGLAELWTSQEGIFSDNDIHEILSKYKKFWFNSDADDMYQSTSLQILPYYSPSPEPRPYFSAHIPLRHLYIFIQIRFLNRYNARIICKDIYKFFSFDDYCLYCSLPEQENIIHFL